MLSRLPVLLALLDGLVVGPDPVGRLVRVVVVGPADQVGLRALHLHVRRDPLVDAGRDAALTLPQAVANAAGRGGAALGRVAEAVHADFCRHHFRLAN